MKNCKSLLPLLPLSLVMWHANADDMRRGEYLAQTADCVACHTRAGGQPFAGGLKMSTPVGDIYSTNITPDKATGIGDYTYDDFANALREGISKSGHQLYPAMPYPSFAKINDEDMHALYDFFMHRVAAVNQPNHDSDISWPLSMRWPLTVWRWIFHDASPYQPDSGQSAEWNRGAYLVQGLEHCGTCHTPRGIGFQEKALEQRDSAYLTGGTLGGWHAPDLTSNQKSGLGHWSTEELQAFLKTGRTERSAAFGPMAEVVKRSTQYLTDADLKAIAVYVKSLKPSDPYAQSPKTDNSTTLALMKGDISKAGAQEYVDNCAACHRLDGAGYHKTFPALSRNPAVLSDDPSSLISIVLKGGHLTETRSAFNGIVMPDFGWRLNDQQVADVLTFIRNGWGNQAQAVTANQVKKLRVDDAKADPH